MKKKPSKPTEPYAYINFSKSGKVSKHTCKLSSDKELQEKEVIEIFKNGLTKKHPELKIYKIIDLPENDHDFKIQTNIGEIELQLTEIHEREYIRQITKEEYNSGKYKKYILKKSGEIPWGVDEEKLDNCIRLAIERKLKKYYEKSKDSILWLLIFSTSTYITPSFCTGGETRVSKGYIIANSYLSKVDKNPFDKIWFTDLLTNPIKIWEKNKG
jgi:hypothetical protein